MDSTTRLLMMGAAGAANPAYVEDVFSTYLYTGNGFFPSGGGQSITNGVDISGKGGMLWIKARSTGTRHALFDTNRGASQMLTPNETGASIVATSQVTSFNSNGFTVGSNSDGYGRTNDNGNTYASWTFRKAPKFFDVVTWTGNGGTQTISHNLGSTPGCIIVKCTSTVMNWNVYHRSLGNSYISVLNSTNAPIGPGATVWGSTDPTSTAFTVASSLTSSGETFVAYLFAHDAGGFGDTGNDSVIKCGSFTTDGSGNATVNLGYEPQWLLVKRTSATQNWFLVDNMRGLPVVSTSVAQLNPNTSDAESLGLGLTPTSTGFNVGISASSDYIYIAIRRGPMKTPTDATNVFTVDTGTNGTSGGIVTTGFPVDLSWTAYRSLGGVAATNDRLRGFGTANAANNTPLLYTSETSAENTGSNPYFYNAWNTTLTRGSNGANPGGAGIVSWFFRRAPGFFDVVAYAGSRSAFDGGSTAISHNLGATPELMIIKSRTSGSYGWSIYSTPTGNTDWLSFDAFGPSPNSNFWNNTTPTASIFTVGSSTYVNVTGQNYIAYLFASCPGVSKIGSYTGTGTTQQINCGFTAGARFILIKRVDGASGSNWYVYDTARGIVSGNDPYLWMNSNAAEVTGTDYIDPLSSGFEISSTAPAAINANGGSFIFLAVA
jgi:hypothetical protein